MAGRDLITALREGYAAEIIKAGWVTDPRIERAFATIPREAFLPPPPWTIFPPGAWMKRTTSDPSDLYADVLVVLDAARGVNNGQPSLHAAWLAAVDPKPGETAIHVGAGSGYYTAILSFLVLPDGAVHAYEIDPRLADLAVQALGPCDHVSVHAVTALGGPLPAADVIYVNAGLAAPDPGWLEALRPGGRMILPWRPFGHGGVTLKVTRVEEGYRAEPSLAVGFVDCVGATLAETGPPLRPDAIEKTRSVWTVRQRAPDDTATAMYGEVWFSSDPV